MESSSAILSGLNSDKTLSLDSAWREGGPNVLAVAVQNTGGPGGLTGEVRLEAGPGRWNADYRLENARRDCLSCLLVARVEAIGRRRHKHSDVLPQRLLRNAAERDRAASRAASVNGRPLARVYVAKWQEHWPLSRKIADQRPVPAGIPAAPPEQTIWSSSMKTEILLPASKSLSKTPPAAPEKVLTAKAPVSRR